MTYCLDTNCLIFGVKREGSSDKVTSAAMFIEQVEKRGDSIMVPTVALCEMLVACNHTQRAQLLAQMETTYVLVDLDTEAAAQCAELEAKLFGADGACTPERRQRRYDLMVAATAKANGADVLVTEDKRLRKILEGYITAQGFEAPGSLFDTPD